MTRQAAANGSSSTGQHPPLPVRSTHGVSPASSAANEMNDRHIQDAINTGKKISGGLAEILRQSSLAENEESNLHQILSLADELRNYQSPVEFTIGLVGDSGVGKSSLINSILDTKHLAKTAGVGTACTTVVTEYRKKRESDTAAYTVEIQWMEAQEIEDLLRQSVIDYRRYHLIDQSDIERPDSVEEEHLQVKAKLAWDTLIAAFAHRDGCTEVLFKNAAIPTDEITRLVLGWKDEIAWPAGFDTSATLRTADNVSDCVARIGEFLEERLWPFIKVVRIYLDALVLKTGIVLADLPGFRDVNSARVRIAEAKLYQCDEIFVVADIGRAVTNKGVEDLVVRQLGKDFNSLKRSQGVAIICTKSEALGQESEVLRDVPNTNEFNPQRMQALKRQIQVAEDEIEPALAMKARRNGIFISARNNHVKQQLKRHYGLQRQVRTIDVFCVSNTLYFDAASEQSRVQETLRNRRRSCATDDRSSAADQMFQSSGILDLRDFIQEIPMKSQIAEVKHFLETKLLTLFEKTNLWLNARFPEIAGNQLTAPEFVQELQTGLETKFDRSVETSYEELTAKTQMLHRPFARGINRWKDAALESVLRWERWHHATFQAFWNNEGAHATAKQPWLDWNEEIIKPMVTDMEPSEEIFCQESKIIFRNLKDSTKQGLDVLCARLSEHYPEHDLLQTFPRRGRNLNYEIENFTMWYFDEFQTIFHNLLKTHGTSYVMHHMLPMYNDLDGGAGVTKRRIRRLKLQIEGEGDRNNLDHPPLFKVIRDLFIVALSAMVEDTKTKLQEAVDKCSGDIRSDLELLRGESAETSDETSFIAKAFDVLEMAQTERFEALREFDAKIRR